MPSQTNTVEKPKSIPVYVNCVSAQFKEIVFNANTSIERTETKYYIGKILVASFFLSSEENTEPYRIMSHVEHIVPKKPYQQTAEDCRRICESIGNVFIKRLKLIS